MRSTWPFICGEGLVAMDETNKHKRIKKPERRYRLEHELVPLLDLLNAEPPRGVTLPPQNVSLSELL